MTADAVVPASRPPTSSSQHADRFRVRWWQAAILVLVVAAGGWLRCHRIDATSLWCDELLSIHLSNGLDFAVDRLPRDTLIRPVPDQMSLAAAAPVWSVWTHLSGDVHPPLYYLALRMWREVFGDSARAIRSLSAVCGTLALVAIFAAGREMLGTTAGLWTATINALASNGIYYSQETRMYALALLFVGLNLALVFRIGRLGFNRARGAALVACLVGAMLTLYLSSAVLLAAAAFVLIRFRGPDRSRTLAMFALAAVVFSIVWLPFFVGQHLDAKKAEWLNADAAGHIATTLNRALLMPMEQFGVPSGRDAAYGHMFALAYLFPLLFVRRCPSILLPWLATLLVVAMPTVADIARSTNMMMWSRYTVLMIPTLSLTLVAASWQLAPRIRPAVPAAIALFACLSLPATYARERYDFRGNALVAEQALHATGGRLILLSTWNEKFDSVLLLAAQHYWSTPPREVVFVESADAFRRLPPEVTGDHVVLFAGDAPASLDELGPFTRAGDRHAHAWAVGVGSVDALDRIPGDRR